MRRRRKIQVQAFSIFASVLMIFSLIMPAFVSANGNGQASITVDAPKQQPTAKEKLNNLLLDEFDGEEMVSFLIKFIDKTDVHQVASDARSDAQKANLSAFNQELRQRSAVISSLKATAMESQDEVLAYLEEEVANGNAENVEPFYIVNGIAVTATKDVAEAVAKFAEVEELLPNTLQEVPVTEATENPIASTDSIEWNIDRVRAPKVWEMGFDGAGTVVATIDSGVEWDHPALKEKYAGYNAATGEVDHTYSFFDAVRGETEPYDVSGHGTHVLGTMVGSEQDGSNQVGVAPGAKWIAVQAFSQTGARNADLLEAAEWLLAPGGDASKAPDVVNNSWGGGTGMNNWFMQVVDAWRAAQIVPVFAAGNVTASNPGGPGSVAQPSNYPQSFAVGNTKHDDMISSTSLRGPSPYGEIKPDVSAPGSAIRSAVPGGDYGLKSGTSMAAPAVSGVVALLRQVNASLTVDEIEQILMDTARERTDEEYSETLNNGYGHGIVDAFTAVSMAADSTGVIEGTVAKEGEDTEAPSFDFVGPPDNFADYDLTLTIQVQDNISVSSVALHYGDNIIEAERISGDYKAGEYAVTIPGEAFTEGDFSYHWVINDYGNNEVVTEQYDLEVKTSLSNDYFEDFETVLEPSGWLKTGVNNSWEHGVPTSGPGSAYSGEKVFATILDGNYLDQMEATLIMPPIDVPAGEDMYLNFKSWHHFEISASGRAWDYGRLVISTDLEEWTILEQFEGVADDWKIAEYNLNDYQGQRIYVGFYTYAGFSGAEPGWYIDNVGLSEQSIYASDSVAPTFDHEAPLEVYEGMNTPLWVDVADNMQVGSATLSYQDTNGVWQTVDAEEINSNVSRTELSYMAIAPGEAIVGENFTYKWIVTDLNGNTNESEAYVVRVSDGVTVGYVEDFEDTPVGWTMMGKNNVWEMGEPTSGPNGAVSGKNVFATNLSGDYPNHMDGTLITPAINVPEGESYLQLNSWNQFEYNAVIGRAYDYGSVQISTDLENWTELQLFFGEKDWSTVAIDLSAYAGQRVYIGFYTYSSPTVVKSGWYIDDVAIVDTIEGDAPTNMTEAYMKNQVETNELSKEKEAVPQREEKSIVEEELNGEGTDSVERIGLPLTATVTVFETGRSTNTAPWDGSYSLLNPEGTYTVVAETYGYRSAEQMVTVEGNQTTEVNFLLEELPLSTINGSITNTLTGEPIENATLLLLEDANISPVQTDAEGNFDLTAYEGTYTLMVVASNYLVQEVEVSFDEDKQLDIALEPFYSIPGEEIGYDDGVAESMTAMFDPGDGWAVKMTLPEGKEKAVVTEGIIKFAGVDWPNPGGTSFAVEVWNVGKDGKPGEKLAGPFGAEAVRDLEQWTVIDLREHHIEVGKEFFMAYIQTKPYPNTPGMAVDKSPWHGRNYRIIDGVWSKAPVADGNFMIRSSVSYGVEGAVLSSDLQNSFTNEETITVNGSATPGTSVELYNDGELAGTQSATETGTFAIDVALTEGANGLVAKTYFEGKVAAISEPVTVTLDTQLPELSIVSPVDGDQLNSGSVSVEGFIKDKNLASVTVNGQEAAVDEGSYLQRILLDAGKNTIEVVATDLAGNTNTEIVTVTADYEAPSIENLEPSQDLSVIPGDEVVISFTSDTVRADASYVVSFSGVSNLASANPNPLVEVEPGVYEGTWVVPEVAFDGVTINVSITDEAGNTTVAKASGRISIESVKDVTRISSKQRYDTAIEISQEGWDSADTVILARGDNFADALAGVPLAHQVDAPILLTPSNKLWEGTLAEIDRLGATKVIILGGQNAVGADVVTELEADGLSVKRIKGANRFETAAAIALEVAGENGANQVVVANGMNFPDALSIAAYAAHEGLPILLIDKDKLPEATSNTLAKLGTIETFVVGGTSVISEEVARTLPGAYRLAGQDRYETNIAIAEFIGLKQNHYYIATGKNYADALTGAVLAAKNNSTVLLVNNKVPESLSTFIVEKGVKRLTIFGGEAAVSREVETTLAELLQ